MFSLFGVLILIGVIISLYQGLGLSSITNIPSLLLVVLGTCGVALISVPKRQIKELVFLFRSLFKKEYHSDALKKDIVALSANRYVNLKTKSKILLYAQELWEQGQEKEVFELFLAERIKQIESETSKTVQSLRNISKYPPALGMMGSIVGLVTLFSNLEDKSTFGSNLAIVLLTTLYGLLISNFIIMPTADRLEISYENMQRHHEFIFRSLCMINDNEHNFIIEQGLDASA